MYNSISDFDKARRLIALIVINGWAWYIAYGSFIFFTGWLTCMAFLFSLRDDLYICAVLCSIGAFLMGLGFYVAYGGLAGAAY